MAKKCKKVCKNCMYQFEPKAPVKKLVKIKKNQLDLGTKVYWYEPADQNGMEYKREGTIKFLTKGTKVWVEGHWCLSEARYTPVETNILYVEA